MARILDQYTKKVKRRCVMPEAEKISAWIKVLKRKVFFSRVPIPLIGV
jgi:hypothetical protein